MDQQLQPSSLHQTVPQGNKSKSKSFIILIFVAIIGAFLGALGMYLVMSSSQSKQPQMTYQSTPQPTLAAAPSRVANSVDNWLLHTNTFDKYTVRYPQNWIVDEVKDKGKAGVTISSHTVFTVKDGKAHLVWLIVHNNPQKLSPVQFWAQRDAFWEHFGQGTSQQRLDEAQKYYDKMERIKIGKHPVEGYRITVADTLARTETYWFIDDKVYNLGFSPEDKSYDYTAEQKEEITNNMLSSFEMLD